MNGQPTANCYPPGEPGGIGVQRAATADQGAGAVTLADMLALVPLALVLVALVARALQLAAWLLALARHRQASLGNGPDFRAWFRA